MDQQRVPSPFIQGFLFTLPLLLLGSTTLVFTSLSRWLGREWGYVLGFVFYDGFWCLAVPRLLPGKGWLAHLFTTAGGLGMLASHDLRHTPFPLLLVVIPAAVITGVCEEILWRGVYVTFSGQVFGGLLYPSLGIAVCQLAPQLVYPAATPGGPLAFAGLTLFLGAMLPAGGISNRVVQVDGSVAQRQRHPGYRRCVGPGDLCFNNFSRKVMWYNSVRFDLPCRRQPEGHLPVWRPAQDTL